MADGYRLAGGIVPSRPGVAGLGTPGPTVGWAFDAIAQQLDSIVPDARYLKILHVGKERFLKPARMIPGGVALTNALLAAIAVAALVGLWLLLTPHGTALFIAGLVSIACLGIYFGSDKAYVRPVAVVVFDVIAPALLAIPLLAAAALQLAAGRRWRAVGSAKRLHLAARGAAVKQP